MILQNKISPEATEKGTSPVAKPTEEEGSAAVSILMEEL